MTTTRQIPAGNTGLSSQQLYGNEQYSKKALTRGRANHWAAGVTGTSLL